MISLFELRRAGFSKVMVLALAGIYLHPGVATACPQGTVFSAKADGTNGICAVIGEGATPYVQSMLRTPNARPARHASIEQ